LRLHDEQQFYTLITGPNFGEYHNSPVFCRSATMSKPISEGAWVFNNTKKAIQIAFHLPTPLSASPAILRAWAPRQKIFPPLMAAAAATPSLPASLG